MKGEEEGRDDEEIVCLDESFFINDDYQLTTFTFGSNVLQLFCLQSASTDFDLTGQLVWPGAMLMNDYLSKNAEMLKGCSIIELGSGVGVTGILCSRFCHQAVLTDHNEEVLKILKKNIELHASSENCAELIAEKLEWGNSDHINHIVQKYSGGFDLILGADISIQHKELKILKIMQDFEQMLLVWFYLYYLALIAMSFQQLSIPPLFNTVEQLLRLRGGKCKFILAYVSRAKIMDSLISREATQNRMRMNEVLGTRAVVGNLEGVIFEVALQ